MWLWIIATMAVAGSTAAAESVYVTNEGSGDISVLQLGSSPSVSKTVSVGKRPRGLRVSPDGTVLYVAVSGSPAAGPNTPKDASEKPDKTADGIAVLSLPGLTRTGTFTGVSDPEQIDVSPDGRRLYVASEDASRLVVFDTASGSRIAEVPIGGEPEGVAASPDGSRVVVTSEVDGTVVAVDTGTWSIVGRTAVGQRPRGVVFAPDGSQIYVTSENDAGVAQLDAKNFAILHSVHLPDPMQRPMGIVPTHDGTEFYVTTGRGREVLRYRAGLGAAPDHLRVGERPWGIALSQDQRFLVSADGPSNSVSVIDRASFRCIATVPVGTKPWGVAAAPPHRPATSTGSH
jgi:YVTN family beta-propeller protein